MNGSVSMPSSVTMNGTRLAMSPAMKATSRPSRSSLATTTGRLELAGVRQRGRKLGTALERVVALAGLDLGVAAGDGEPVLRAEGGDRGFLGLKPEAGLALLDGADPGVARRRLASRSIFSITLQYERI